MKRVFFHMNGKLFTNFKAIAYGRMPVNVKDFTRGEGYFSIQNNIMNPSDPLKWEQNTLEIGGQSGELANKVQWGKLIGPDVSKEIMDIFDVLLATEFFSVTLEISGYKMSVDIEDIIADKQLLHEERTYLNRIDILAAEGVIVGFGDGSAAFFRPEYNSNINDNFYVQVSSTDGDLTANIIDTDAPAEKNMEAMTIGGVNLNTGMLTAEYSNLTAELILPNTVELKL